MPHRGGIIAQTMGLLFSVSLAAALCANGVVKHRSTDSGDVNVADGDYYSSEATYGEGTCIWTVTATSATTVLAFQAAPYYLGPNNDRIEIYDGSTTHAPRLGTLVGWSNDANMVSWASGNALTFVLVTDNFDHWGGFNITVSGQYDPPEPCKSFQVVNSSIDDYFTNPATLYQIGTYKAGMTCQWLFTLMPGELSMRIQFDIEGIAYGDYLEIYDGSTVHAPLLGRQGAGQGGNYYWPNGVTALVRFVSQPGDKLFYKGFGLGLYTFDVPQHCSGRLLLNTTQNRQSAAEPWYSWLHNGYKPGETCEWLITAPPGMAVYYKLDQMQFNGGDTFIVYDGLTTSAPSHRYTYSDGYGPDFSTGTNSMLVVFTSQPDIAPAPGFVFEFWHDDILTQCKRGPVHIIQDHVDSSPYADYQLSAPTPNYYPTYSRIAPGRTCQWIIESNDDYDIYLFSDQYVLNPGDNLTIYSMDDITNATTVVKSIVGPTNALYRALTGRWQLNIPQKRALIQFVSSPVGGDAMGWYMQFGFYQPHPDPPCEPFSQFYPTEWGHWGVNVPGYHNGQFYSPGFTCMWLINGSDPYYPYDPPDYDFIYFSTSDFDFRPGDSLKVYDGSSTNDKLMGEVTGWLPYAEQEFYSSGPVMLIVFESKPGGVASSTGFSSYTEATDDNGYDYYYSDYCATQGDYSMNVDDDSQWAISGYDSDHLDAYPRNVTCTWHYTRSDYVAGEGGFLIYPRDGTRLHYSMSVMVYDGPDSSAPMIYSIINGEEAWYNYDNPTASVSADLTVVFFTGYERNYIDGDQGLNLEIAPYYQHQYYPYPQFCNGLQVIDLTDTDSHRIAVQNDWSFFLQPNMHCQWLVTAEKGDLDYPVVSLWRDGYYGDYSGDCFPDEYNVTVYDGTNANAPVLWRRGFHQDEVVFSGISGSLYITYDTFNGPMRPQPGFQFRVRRQEYPFRCYDGEVSRFDDEYWFESNWYWNGLLNTPWPQLCSWTVSTNAGSVWMLQGFQIDLLANEEVVVYDGLDTTAPVVFRLVEYGRVDYGYATTGPHVHVVFVSNRTDESYGFQIHATTAVPPDNVCAATQHNDIDSLLYPDNYDYYVGNGQDALVPGDIYVDAPSKSHAFPQGVGACEHTFVVPMGYYLSIDINWNMIYGQIDVLNNDQYIISGVGINENGMTIRYMCGNVTLRLNIAQQPWNTFWRLHMYISNWVEYIPYNCRAPDDVVFGQDEPQFIQPEDTAPYQNVTIMTRNFRFSQPFPATNNGTAFSLPRLRYATQAIYINNFFSIQQVLMNNLRVTSELHISLVVMSGTYSLPSLLVADGIYIDHFTVDGLTFPAMKFNALIDARNNEFQTISFPSLIAIDYRSTINDNDLLVTANYSSLIYSNCFYFDGNAKLAEILTPKMEIFGGYEVQYALISSMSFPLVTSYFRWLNVRNNPILSEILLPNCTGFEWLDVTSDNQLVRVYVPKVTWIEDEFCARNTHLESVDLPSAITVRQIWLTGAAYLTSINLPSLTTLFDLDLEDSVVASISVPSLQYQLGDITLSGNFKLNQLDMCAMTESNHITVSNCQQLSCQETVTLFNSTGAGYIDAVPPNCDGQLVGTFGCRENVVHTVDTVGCGWTLPCVQHAIDASYFDKHGIVFLPTGTYTDCSVPLNVHGKRITLRGAAGSNPSVIDCGGSGQALVVDESETAAFQIEDLTLTNGAAELGGLVQIIGASPTFRHVTFLAGSATTGGAVHASANSKPTFVDCTFMSSRASDGGALAVVDSAVTLNGCAFDSNTAANQAGAVLLLSTTRASVLMGSSFTANLADQGGAVFSDSALQMRGCTLSENSAGQFGGALASVPADAAAGTWTNISDSTFERNAATTGGAIYGFSSNLEVRNSTLESNHVLEDGGAISALCSPSYRILRGIKGTCAVYILIDESEVFNNSATGNGAGVSVQDVRLSTSGGLWSANKAGGSGGALYSTTSLLSASHVSMSQNNAKKTGGGLYCEPYTGSCDVTSSSFSGNSASVAGGAVYLCTSNCPNVTRSGQIISDGPLPDLAGVNTFDANAVANSGYGKDLGSDPSQLTWLVPPSSSVISGRAVSTSGSISVQVTDNYGAVVTSSKTILALSLEVTDAHGSDLSEHVAVQGSNTALAVRGTAVFSEPLLVAATIADANLTVLVSVRLSETVSLGRSVTLSPCAPGQGRSAVEGDPVVCVDCVAGSAASADTNYICELCPVGSAAATATAAACTLCTVNTHAPLPGSTACLPCATGYSAPQPGATDCIQDASAAITAPASIVAPIAGASAGVVLIIIIGAICLYRLARRKTMQKYYLDSDSTIRASGMEETPLMKSVKKIIGASSTTRAGGGMFADVYKAKYENKWIALKVIKKELVSNQEAQMEFRREAVALSRLLERRCRGIVELAFFLERNPMCVGMEFCNNGTLKRLLPVRALAPYDKIRMAAEAAAAMVVVHGCNIVHLDLKTDNLLLDDDMHVKLADFGISRLLDRSGNNSGLDSISSNPVFGASQNPIFGASLPPGGGTIGGAANKDEGGRRMSVVQSNAALDSMGSAQGSLGNLASFGATAHFASEAFTPQYVDPLRMIDSTNQSDEFLRASDLFSFGIVMWTIFSQEEPYAGQTPDALMKELRERPATRPRDIPGIHPEYDRIMRQCWHKDPPSRPTFLDVRTRLTTIMRDEFGGNLAERYIVDGSSSNELSTSDPLAGVGGGGGVNNGMNAGFNTLDSSQFSGKAFGGGDTMGSFTLPPPPMPATSAPTAPLMPPPPPSGSARAPPPPLVAPPLSGPPPPGMPPKLPLMPPMPGMPSPPPPAVTDTMMASGTNSFGPPPPL